MRHGGVSGCRRSDNAGPPVLGLSHMRRAEYTLSQTEPKPFGSGPPDWKGWRAQGTPVRRQGSLYE